MQRTGKVKWNAAWSALLVLLALTGCGDREGARGGGDAELALISAPRVGDVYAAELSAFSTADFEEVEGKLYGLMKVVDVNAERVVVVTENAAAESPKVSRQDILGDMSDIEFDEEERIDIVLPQLRQAWDDGRIYEVRRQ